MVSCCWVLVYNKYYPPDSLPCSDGPIISRKAMQGRPCDPCAGMFKGTETL